MVMASRWSVSQPGSEHDRDAGRPACPRAASLERDIASGFEENEHDTGLYGSSLTRLTGLVGIAGIYVESPPAEAEDH